MGNRFGRAWMLALLLAGFLWAAPSASAQDGPVFLVVNLDEGSFDTDLSGENQGSNTVVVFIGTMVGGGDVLRDVTFLSATLGTIPLGDQTLADLDGNFATILGSYQTSTEDTHLVTPEDPALIDGGIPPEIQQAFFLASADLLAAIDPNLENDNFITTKEISEIVAGYTNEQYNADEVADYIFGGATPLSLTSDSVFCEAEGELFPHNPDEPLFNFAFQFNEDGDLTYDLCTLVDVDVKPESIKLSEKGVLSISIYSNDAIDTDDLDTETITINGVAYEPKAAHFANGKVVLDFYVSELYDGGDGVLTKDTTELAVRALLTDGTTCIEGSDTVKVK